MNPPVTVNAVGGDGGADPEDVRPSMHDDVIDKRMERVEAFSAHAAAGCWVGSCILPCMPGWAVFRIKPDERKNRVGAVPDAFECCAACTSRTCAST